MKIERKQKEFLKAMKAKFTEDEIAASIGLHGLPTATYQEIDCPICKGRGYHGLKRAPCHSCRGTGKKKVRVR